MARPCQVGTELWVVDAGNENHSPGHRWQLVHQLVVEAPAFEDRHPMVTQDRTELVALELGKSGEAVIHCVHHEPGVFEDFRVRNAHCLVVINYQNVHWSLHPLVTTR